MTWRQSPKTLSPATLRWVADQAERDSKQWAEFAEAARKMGYDDDRRIFGVKAADSLRLARRLRTRATRIEKQRSTAR